MPLAGRHGPPELPISTEIPLTVHLESEEHIIDHQSYIEDSFINKTAVNPETYAETFQLLQRYVSGSRIVVTYFLRSTPTGGLQRSDAIDPSGGRNPVYTSYTQINEFEIVVQGKGLHSGFDSSNQETKITGDALVYPGMRPRNGDLFITPIGDAVYGIFQVTGVERLTYRQGSNHRITFFLREYASDEGVALIKKSVTKTVWFDKETYLGDTTTLLKEESYICLKALKQMRGILIRHYYNTFYDNQMCSIIAPDGTYDPYLVHYLNSRISLMESNYRPSQLYPILQNYDNSLWARLSDRTNRTLIGLQSNYSLLKVRSSRYDVTITSLINRVMVSLRNPNRQAMESTTTSIMDYNVPPVTIPYTTDALQPLADLSGYILSQNFYNGDKTLMTPFEFMVYAVICNRRLLDVKEFIDGYLNHYNDLTYDQRYYYIPLYLWLIDVGIEGISAADTFMT